MAGNTPVALTTLVSIILWLCSLSLAAQNQTQTILSILGKISKESVSFARFAKRHGKSYKTVEEIQFRFQAYKDNLETIRAHNQESLPYTLSPNEFIDLTWDEFRVQNLAGVKNCSTTQHGNHKLTNDILPQMKDWRKDGIIGPVKDQRTCGACWAFSATGALEAAYTQKYKKNVSLSEQQLLGCSQAYKNFGCRGGLPSQAFEYLKSVGGIETEGAYPYAAKSGKCKFAFKKIVVKVVDSVNITMGDEDL